MFSTGGSQCSQCAYPASGRECISRHSDPIFSPGSPPIIDDFHQARSLGLELIIGGRMVVRQPG